MQLGESRERQLFETRDVLSVALGNQRQHIISPVVPRASGRMRIAASDHAELRKRRRTGKSLIRKNFVSRGMIDSHQPHLVEINRFFHRLHKAETQQAVPRLHAAPSHLQVFVRIGHVSLPGRNPMAHHPRPNHVRDEFILAPIPCKQNRARTSAPIQFRNAVHLFCRQVYFVLRHARRPQQPNDFRVALRSETGKNRRSALS